MNFIKKLSGDCSHNNEAFALLICKKETVGDEFEYYND